MTLADFINRIPEMRYDVVAQTNEDWSTTIKLINVEQDFSFTVNSAKEIEDYYEGYDIEEEVTNWLEAKRNGFRGVPGVLELVEECKTIDKTLKELAMRTSQLKGV